MNTKQKTKELEHTNCDLCRSEKTELLFESTDMLLGAPGVFNIVRCIVCGFVYITPRPAKQNIHELYAEDKYFTCYPIPSSTSIKSGIKELVHESMPGYAKQLSGPKRFFGKILGWLFSSQMDMFVPYIPAGKLLDVGCGNGQQTSWMVKHGWDVYGNDIAPAACKYAESAGLEIFCGDLDKASYRSDFFDVVIVNHVLEHVHSPTQLLAECHRILKKGGLLIMGVPNFGAFKAQLFGPYWSGLDAPRHLNHFTLSTLKKITISAGFEIERLKLKLPLPLLDKRSLEFMRRAGLRRRQALMIYLNSYALQPFVCLLRGKIKGSANIALYAIKQ